ncbi:MAG: TetR/AcrR family transcriptional regulator [Desulfovibrio sp.]|uniref:TetR/AcrR family transcriptional regulator n=1 Tax=Desulfovibrio sp. 7SRBS1 TaxID=3378064 RepID=UPI003B3C5ACE
MPCNADNKHNPKISLLIDHALEVLRDHGEQGMSMRKVAAKAGMSLGNLQYYFKNKDELLAGVVDEYFDRCALHYNTAFAERCPEGRRETIEFLVRYGMAYADSEIGKVFRELWGIAARNKTIAGHMDDYYREYTVELAQVLAPFAKSPDCVSRVVSLMLPFVEGYGLVAGSLPSSTEELTEFIVNIVDSSL